MILRHARLPQSIHIAEILGNHALRIEKRSVQRNRLPYGLDKTLAILIETGKTFSSSFLL